MSTQAEQVHGDRDRPSDRDRPPDPDSPWRTLSRTEVYDNPWITVREDAVVRPDGNEGIYGVVDMKRVALGAVPLFTDGDTLLVGQYRYALDAYSWEIPEGGGDPDVEPLTEIRRELREETGLDARQWTELGGLHPSNCVTSERGLLWLAEGLGEHDPDPDGSEELRSWRLPFDEAVAMALDGRLTDSMTVVGLCRARALIDRRQQARTERG